MTIAVAVSGGMDSLLALALLREAGYDALALHARFLPPDADRPDISQDLETTCRKLGARLHIEDLSQEFRRLVIEPFKSAYTEGLTPNPCAACNRDMKFGLLADAALRLGANHIATGHYARLCPSLCRGVDEAKDQSYFLTLTPREALERAVFPLGGWLKSDVREALATRGLTAPLPSESQEVCFVPDDDYRAFLESEGVSLAGGGPVVLPDGREIGRHEGLWRHTLGQRKGIKIAWSEPLYVVDKLQERNALVAGPKSALYVRECRVRNVNMLASRDEWPEIVLAQTCYRQRPVPARAEMRADGKGSALHFETDVPRPAPGQVAALFDANGRALAGGIVA